MGVLWFDEWLEAMMLCLKRALAGDENHADGPCQNCINEIVSRRIV